ncbi:MAG: hypothetical protein ACLP01_25200 [Solirubrobacteraceae bacterium]
MATAIHVDVPAHVVINDSRLLINDLVLIGTPMLVAREHQERGGNPETIVRQMIEIGATVIQHGAGQATVDSVTTQITRLIDAINHVTAEQLPSTIDEQLKAIRTVLGEHFDPEKADSIQQQLKTTFTAQNAEQQRALRTALLDDTGPLGIVRTELATHLKAILASQGEVGKQLTALTERLTAAERIKEERQRGTAHGADYEDQVATVLEWIHAPLEDTVLDVGTELGAHRNKAGDHVVHLNPDITLGRDLRIVVESKAQPLGVKAALEQLERAMENREAQAGVLVFASADLAPLKGRALRAYSGNRFIAVYDREEKGPLALEAACHLARTLTLATLIEGEEAIDTDYIADQLERLTSVVEEGRSINRGINAARKGIDTIEAGYDTLRSKALAIIKEVGESLT